MSKDPLPARTPEKGATASPDCAQSAGTQNRWTSPEESDGREASGECVPAENFPPNTKLSRDRRDSEGRVETSPVARPACEWPGSAPNWRMAMRISGPTMRSLYRDNALGVQMERWCKRREGNGPMGYTYSGGGVAYFIDGDKIEYKTEAALLGALTLKPNTPAEARAAQPTDHA